MPIPQNYSAPVKLSAKDRAYNQIQEWIVDGTLVPNEKINDAQLANALGISRTPVREALQLLALQGLVAMKPGVSTYVTELEDGAMGKILPPLSVLQALAAQTAADMADENGYVEDDYRIDYLAAHINTMRDAINEDGVELWGYTTWGCIDLVSAGTGEMKKRYGFIYIDRDNDGKGSLKSSKKKSFNRYKEVIASNGASVE